MLRWRGSYQPCNASIPRFNTKGSEKEFSLNSVVLEHVQSASTSLEQAVTPQVEKSLKELKEDEKNLFHRNKLNLIADSSGEGWEVVNEYQRGQGHTTSRGESFTETPARPIGERKTAFASSKAPSLPVSPLPIVVSGYGTLVSPSYPDISSLGLSFENSFGADNWPGGSCFTSRSFDQFRN